MVWEPNALDGQDDRYRLDWPWHDPSGRYIPYFTRNGGQIKRDIGTADEDVKHFEEYRHRLRDFVPGYEKPGWGDYYVVPRRRNRDTATEPFPYTVQGIPVLETSLVVAMHDAQGRFVGASGVDLPLTGLQHQIGTFHPFGIGRVTLLSSKGLYVVADRPAQLGKPMEAGRLPAGLQASLAAGKGGLFERAGLLEVWRPVRVGATGQYWALGVSIPLTVILAEADRVRNQAIMVGGSATFTILLLLGFLLTVLTEPLKRLACEMEALASGQGDFSRRLPVGTLDEIGRTSEAFNRMMAMLSQQALQDQLTGALNRRGVQEVFAAELSRSERGEQSLCVALLDLDNFKRLNDAFGHQAGDSALQHLVGVVRESVRPTDWVARYGGEEFLILLPCEPIERAVAVMERVQDELMQRPFAIHGERMLITFSAGVALHRPGESADEVVARADAAMYRAKLAGKNRVLAADEPVLE
jgi:diguanylate cyclase (GGDEF)-like protein